MRLHRLAFPLLLATAAATGCGDDGDELVIRIPDGGARPDAGQDAGPARECTPEGEGSTIGQACLNDRACDDGCFCNGLEVCRGGLCDVGPAPCEDDFDCTTNTCDEAADSCAIALDDTRCDDGNSCNGAEICDPDIGCAPGPGIRCTDGDPCTVDSCDATTGECVFPIRDLDGDGFGDATRGCGGLDCNDNPLDGAAVNPDATEDCSNGIDDDCDREIDLADDACNPTNVSCEAPEELASSGDSLFWKSEGLTDGFDLGCDATTNVYDAVFSFTLEEPANVVARVTGGGTGQVVALRSAAGCDDDVAGDLACDAGTTTSPALIEVRNVQAGDYVLIASVRTETFFTVSLELGPATPPPPSDTCDPVETPLIPVDATTTFSGVWADHEDDFASPDCANISSGGVDVVHRISLTEPKDVRIEARGTTGTAGTTSTRTGLYLITDCSDLTTVRETECAQGTSSPPPSVFARPLPAGDYYVVLEKAFSGTTGTWELTATIEDPVPRTAGDVCAGAIDITTASATVDIATIERDTGLGCDGGSAAWKDAYFLVDLSEPKDVTIETTGDGLHLMSFADGVCGDAMAETLCRASTTTAREVFRNLPAGEYYVAVGTARSTGEITARATLTDPTPAPSNDTCAGARAITSGSTVIASGLAATDTAALACGVAGRADLWYEFTLAADATVVITAEPADASDTDDVAVELRAGCADTPTVCGSGSPASITRSLTAGTYRIAVESLGRGERDIELRLVVL